MKKFLMVVFTMCLGLCFSLADVPLVKAQESGSDEFTLEEITITAQKREQDLQKVATNVEVIQGYELTEMGMLDLDDALKNISNALVSPAGEEMNVIIRSMDNDSMPGDQFSQVAVTVDGSFSANWGVGTTGLFDMQRIEVLAGPQGTLYSRNSAGGVVNMISNNPTTEEVRATGSVELGNYNLVNTQGMLNVPMGDAWAVRAAFISTKRDGYASNGLYDADDRSLRLKLGYTPSDNLSAIMTYEYTRIGGKSMGNGFEPFEDEDDVDDPWTNNHPGDLFHGWTSTNRYYMNLDWTTPIGTVTFLPSYTDTDRRLSQSGWVGIQQTMSGEMEPSISAMAGSGDYEAEQVFLSPQWEKSLELRMASPEDFFMEFLVGLYYYEREWKDKILNEELYYYTDNGDDSDDYVVPSNIDTATWGVKGGKSTAAFGNFIYPITNTVRINGGIRYTKEKETSSGGEPYESSHPDYKAGLEYDIGENTMLWVDYSTGISVVRGSQRDQETRAYQAGSKSRFLENKLQLNATAFYYDYTNFNVGQGINSVYLVEWDEDEGAYREHEYSGSGVGDAIIYGLDVSSNYVITSADRLNLSLSYLTAEIDEVLVTYTYDGAESPDVPPTTIPSGKPLNNAPEWTVVLGYQHRFDLTNGDKITPNINIRYTAEYSLEFEPEEQNVPAGMDVDKVNTEPASIMGDVSLNYSHSGGRWSLNGYVKNITNHAQKNGMMRGDMRLGPPRTYGAVLSVTF